MPMLFQLVAHLYDCLYMLVTVAWYRLKETSLEVTVLSALIAVECFTQRGQQLTKTSEMSMSATPETYR